MGFSVIGGNASEQMEAGIGITIRKIVADFLVHVNPQGALLYHCDTTDNRQLKRSRLFARWFDQDATNKAFYHQQVAILFPGRTDNDANQGVEFYAGLIALAANPALSNIREEFEAQILLFASGKRH